MHCLIHIDADHISSRRLNLCELTKRTISHLSSVPESYLWTYRSGPGESVARLDPTQHCLKVEELIELSENERTLRWKIREV